MPATAATHRRMHVYPAGRDDFADLLSNVERLAGHVPDLGISFVLDEENYREIALAADIFLTRGAAFVEYKPKYLPGYRADTAWLKSAAAGIREQIGDAVARWQGRSFSTTSSRACSARVLSRDPWRCRRGPA